MNLSRCPMRATHARTSEAELEGEVEVRREEGTHLLTQLCAAKDGAAAASPCLRASAQPRATVSFPPKTIFLSSLLYSPLLSCPLSSPLLSSPLLPMSLFVPLSLLPSLAFSSFCVPYRMPCTPILPNFPPNLPGALLAAEERALRQGNWWPA